MNHWIKNLLAVIISILVIFIVIAIGSFYMLKSSLPDYSGVIVAENLSEEVEIYRDEYAVPYINAKTEMDAYFALGYVHAQERLFQMDISRRAGEGRLSELFGRSTVEFDKLFKTLGLLELVKNNFNSYDEVSKQMLTSYSNGVNEFIRNSPKKFTIEFDLLGYTPYVWKPEHSLLIAKLMAWELNISWWSDIAITHLIQKLGKEKVEDILPNFDENGPTIIPDKLDQYSLIPKDIIKIDRSFRKFIGNYGTHIGSNNWVIDGRRSVTGKPIIANDPHLGFAAPAKWYVVSIKSPNFNADGFSLPGIPGIVIGKNENIAWAVTNVMADDSDFYIETFDSSNTKYLFNGEWKQLFIKTDTIKVKDSTDVIFEILKNHRGPIISGVHNYNDTFPNDYQKNVNISMRWTGLDPSNELLAFYKLNRAKNWHDFNESLKGYYSPGQNFLYCDSKGNIGYRAGVRLPLRKINSSSFVYDGTTDQYDWNGFIPFNENPSIYNSSKGFLATANNKVLDNFPYHISNIWEPTSRITRIYELLNGKDKHSVKDFKNYQNDFISIYSKKLIPFVLNAFENQDYENANLKSALKLFKQWNFEMNSESQVAAINAVFFQYLMKNIFLDEMGEELFHEYVFLANIPLRVVLHLLENNSSDWFDNLNTKEIENRDIIIRKSLKDAVSYLEEEIDGDIKYWQWGNMHTVTFKHMFHGESDILNYLLDVGPFPIGGDGTTIFNGEYYFTSPYENKLGPSMRYLYDFSETGNFEYILPTGQSGHFFSDHYNDMTQMWLKGEYIILLQDLDSLKLTEHSLLRLQPN